MTGSLVDDRTEPNQAGPGRRRRLRIRWLLLGLAVTVVLFLIATGVLFVWPPTDPPSPADAILSLNGRNETAREALAISLAKRGFAPVLLFSQGNAYNTPCPSVPRVHVVCFEPIPGRTVGEVEFAASYARARGWRHLIVVAGRPQSLRARLLTGRCFSGSVTVMGAPVKRSQLPYEVAYEWAALGKALFVDRHC